MMMRIAIVDGHTQAGKTWKSFEVIKKYHGDAGVHGDSICIYITQANSKALATQTVGRALCDDAMRAMFDDNIYDINDKAGKRTAKKTTFLVGYWDNTRTGRSTIKMLKEGNFKHATLLFDECDAGGMNGVEYKLSFVNDLYAVCMSKSVDSLNLIFVTATIANLCKSFLRLSSKVPTLPEYDCFRKIIDCDEVEHYYVDPPDEYVGPSWFVENNIWKKIEFPKKLPDEEARKEVLIDHIIGIDAQKKRLSLVSVTSSCVEQNDIANRLITQCDYNVTLLMNSSGVNNTNKNNKDFTILYISDVSNEVSEWYLPYSAVERAAKAGKLDWVIDSNTAMRKRSGIDRDLSNVTLAHVMQAALFIGTDYTEQLIDMGIVHDEWIKLIAIAGMMQRPDDYPESPRVAIVSGNMIGRGFTVQNPAIRFVCSSFVFTHTDDGGQRGAQNAQKFGRACGMLKTAYQQIKPVLLATDRIVMDALLNQAVTSEKGDNIADGEKVSIKSLISEEEWKEYQNNIREKLGIAKPKKTIIVKKATKQMAPLFDKTLIKVSKRDIPNGIDVHMVTTYEVITVDAFMARFELKAMPERASDLSRILNTNSNKDFNVSYTKSSIEKVAYLKNYFENNDWDGGACHVIRDKDEWHTVRLIHRNRELLNKLSVNDFVCGHDHNGGLQHYKCITKQ